MPKVWMALFFGYNGSTFQGMQYQLDESVVSVEKLLVTRLHDEGFLPTRNYPQLVRNYKFGRAARTDKGVHAVVNAVACLMNIDQQFYDEGKVLQKDKLIAKLRQVFENTELAIHAVYRVTCRFDIRALTKSRTYCYICPANYFIQDAQEEEKTLAKINQCCQKFIGTHNFHNYSKDIKCKDPKAKRYVMEFQCHKLDDKWLKFVIKGQSFVYHQIRKIIGSILQVFLSEYEPDFINNTFFNNQFYVPLAPPFGLYLNYMTFESYNRKPDIPEQILLSQYPAALQKMQQSITQHILKVEDSLWQGWLEQVRQGVVPKFEEDDDQPINDQ